MRTGTPPTSGRLAGATPADRAASAPDLVRVLDDDGVPLPGAALPDLTPARAVELYEAMTLMRAIDARLEGLQRMGRIGFFGSARGQEASVIGSGAALEAEDWVFPALRENGIMLLRGYPLARYFAHMFGNVLDPLRGRMQPMHFAAREVNFVSWSSCIANQLPQAVGAAWAMKKKKDGRVAMGFIGDGGTSEPDFASSLNFAAVWRVPCVFVIQNNQWAISVPVSKQSASSSLAIKAQAFGLPGVRVDGNDLLAVYRETRAAVDRARRGEGPTLLELVTFRLGGHSSADDPSRYRDAQEVERWQHRCPLRRLRAWLESRGLWDEARETALGESQRARLSDAVKEAERASPPPPEDLVLDVYKDPPPALLEQGELLKAELKDRPKKG